VAPVIDLTDKRKKKENQPQEASQLTQVPALPPALRKVEPIKSDLVAYVADDEVPVQIEEEYDPLKPNDYEKLSEEIKKKRPYHSPNSNSSDDSGSNDHSQKIGSRSKNSGKPGSSNGSSYASFSRPRESRSELRPRYDDEDDYNTELPAKRSHFGGAAFAPPPSLLENNEPSQSEPVTFMPVAFKTDTITKSSPGAKSMAEKMMEKMGYKEGDGLGRNKQGMSVALQVEKTGMRTGRIIHEKDIKAVEPPKETVATDVMKNPSKVVLLRNMVGPGEVDGELENETKEECHKYGEVNKCVIFEIPDAEPEDAVRIFIEFKSMPSAIKALVDLNGRFFGGRKVKATFYNLDKFRRLDLADEP